MSKYAEIFNFMRTCPELSDLWSIGATENGGESVILPFGSSETVKYNEEMDVTGNYSCDIVPYPSVYEEYQINCFQMYDNSVNDSPEINVNVLNIDKVQSIIDWIGEQNVKRNLPKITGKKVVSIECQPQVPQIRYVDEASGVIAYFITLRVRYVNTVMQTNVYYGYSD